MEALTALSISQPLRRGYVLRLHFISFLSVGLSVEALYCTFYQSALHGGFVLHFLSVAPWKLYTALYVSWPLCGGFILHFLLLSPFVEVSYLLVSPWRPHTSLSISRSLRGGLALRFHQSAFVEALYCIVLPFVMMTFYQSVPSWRPCTTLPSVGVEALYCIVLPFVMMTRKSVKGKHFSLTISAPTLLR